MAVFTDDFTASDGTSLTGRAGWTKYGLGADDSYLVASNRVKIVSDGPLLGQDKGAPEHFAEAAIYAGATRLGGITRFKLVVRGVDRNRHIFSAYDTDEAAWGIYAVGTSNDGRFAFLSAAGPAGEIYRLEASGTTYALYKDDVAILSNAIFSDPNVNSATISGIAGSVASPVDPAFDLWRSGLIGDLGAGGSLQNQRIVGGGIWG